MPTRLHWGTVPIDSQPLPLVAMQYGYLHTNEQWSCLCLQLSCSLDGPQLFNSRSMQFSTVSQWGNLRRKQYDYLHLHLPDQLHRHQLSNAQSMFSQSLLEQWHLHHVKFLVHLLRVLIGILRRSLSVCQSMSLSIVCPRCLSNQSDHVDGTMCLLSGMDRGTVRSSSALFEQSMPLRYLCDIVNGHRLHLQLYQRLLWSAVPISDNSITVCNESLPKRWNLSNDYQRIHLHMSRIIRRNEL